MSARTARGQTRVRRSLGGGPSAPWIRSDRRSPQRGSSLPLAARPGSPGFIKVTDPEVAVLDRMRLRLEPDRTFRRDREGLLQHLAVAGAAGKGPLAVGGVLDGHLDGVPVALLVVLEFLVGADARVVADL